MSTALAIVDLVGAALLVLRGLFGGLSEADRSAVLALLRARLAAAEAELTTSDDPSVPTGLRRPRGAGLQQEYSTLLNHLNSGGGYGAGGTEGRPTAGALERKADLDRTWSEARGRLVALLEAEVAGFNAEVRRLGLEGIVLDRN